MIFNVKILNAQNQLVSAAMIDEHCARCAAIEAIEETDWNSNIFQEKTNITIICEYVSGEFEEPDDD